MRFLSLSLSAILLAFLVPRCALARDGAGRVFLDNLSDGSKGPEMVVIPTGRFFMGSPVTEADRIADEGPQHRVRIAALALSKTELTVAQFRQFVDATGYRTDAERNTDVPTRAGPESGCYTELDYAEDSSWRAPGFAQTERHPVVCLSWNDADAYVRWLAAQTGQGYRLPSEAELEYALRAGSASRYAWGADADRACRHANVLDQTALLSYPGAAVARCGDGFLHTSPVASFQANAFGLHDTVGNAWEWSGDCWHADYDKAPADGRARTTGDCGRRSLRGVSWSAGRNSLRAADRSVLVPTYRNNTLGMRLAREL
jgi:formylglycine-generating enzyme required for sulfatase activity